MATHRIDGGTPTHRDSVPEECQTPGTCFEAGPDRCPLGEKTPERMPAGDGLSRGLNSPLSDRDHFTLDIP